MPKTSKVDIFSVGVLVVKMGGGRTQNPGAEYELLEDDVFRIVPETRCCADNLQCLGDGGYRALAEK